jgi:hypothetical protein
LEGSDASLYDFLMLAKMSGEVLCWHARIIWLRWTNASASSRLASAPPPPRIRFTVTSGASTSTPASAPALPASSRSRVITTAPMPPELTRYAFHLALSVRKHGLIVR